MLGRSLGLTITCALGASAFLLPPGIASDKDVTIPSLGLDPHRQSIALPCSSCAFSEKSEESIEEGDLVWAQGGAKSLALNFAISDDGQALLLNGEALYPAGYAVDDIRDDWVVAQIAASTSREQLATGDYLATPLRITGQMFGMDSVEMITPDGDNIIQVRWQLLSLEHQLMTVDEVLVQLLRTSEGELLILSIDTVPGITTEDSFPPEFSLSAPRPGSPKHSEDCSLPGPLCRLGNFIESKIGSKPGRPCGGRKPDSFDGHLPTHIKPHFGKEGHHGPHGHHHHHRHGMFHAVSRAILSVLIPVIAGITVGMVVSVLGLLTGHFIGWLWFTVIRGGKRGYARVASDDVVLVVDADQKLAVEEIEPLPLYEDAPAYEATEKEML